MSRSRLSLKAESSQGNVKEVMLTSYVQGVNHLMETWATDDMIAEANTNIVQFNHQTNREPYNMPMLYGGRLHVAPNCTKNMF